jgi:hypothetical protein
MRARGPEGEVAGWARLGIASNARAGAGIFAEGRLWGFIWAPVVVTRLLPSTGASVLGGLMGHTSRFWRVLTEQAECLPTNPMPKADEEYQAQARFWPRAFLARSSRPRNPRAQMFSCVFSRGPRAFLARKCSRAPVSRVLAILARRFSRVLARRMAPRSALARSSRPPRAVLAGSRPSPGFAPCSRAVLARLSEGPSWRSSSRVVLARSRAVLAS